MLNEGVFRSPKWLRNFVDFEINTGKDIKGEKSEKSKEKEKKKLERERLNTERERERAKQENWKLKWDAILNSYNEREKFKDFFNEFYKSILYNYGGRVIFSSDLDKIKENFKGDFTLFDNYEKWKLKNIENERAQKRILQELDDLFNRIVKDFSNNPYDDKIKTPRENGEICFIYTFEQGDTFKMRDNVITYGGSIYTVSLTQRNRFIGLANEISSKSRKRPTQQGSKTGYQQGAKKTHSDNPIYDRYTKLKDNIKLRQEQLNKMSKSDPERSALENELENYKKAAERMKNRHKFENLVSFHSYHYRVN
jgi:hypothetical protein